MRRPAAMYRSGYRYCQHCISELRLVCWWALKPRDARAVIATRGESGMDGQTEVYGDPWTNGQTSKGSRPPSSARSPIHFDETAWAGLYLDASTRREWLSRADRNGDCQDLWRDVVFPFYLRWWISIRIAAEIKPPSYERFTAWASETFLSSVAILTWFVVAV